MSDFNPFATNTDNTFADIRTPNQGLPLNPFAQDTQKKSIDQQLNDVENELKIKKITIPSTGQTWRIWDLLNILRYPITNMLYTAVKEQAEGDGLGLDDFGKIIKSAVLGVGAALPGIGNIIGSDYRHNSEDVVRMLFPDQKEWVYKLAGFAGDILTDPLTYISFGAAGGTKGLSEAATEAARVGAGYEKAIASLGEGTEAFKAAGKALIDRFGGKTWLEAIENGIRTTTKELSQYGLRPGILGISAKSAGAPIAAGTPLDWIGNLVGKVGGEEAGLAVKNLPTAINRIPIVGNIQRIFSTTAQWGYGGGLAKDISLNVAAEGSRRIEVLRNNYNTIFKDTEELLKNPTPFIEETIKGVTKKTFDKQNTILSKLVDMREAIAEGSKKVYIPTELKTLNDHLSALTDDAFDALKSRGLLTPEQYIELYFPRRYINQSGEVAVITGRKNSIDAFFRENRTFKTVEEARQAGYELEKPLDSLAQYLQQVNRVTMNYDLDKRIIDTYGVVKTNAMPSIMRDFVDVKVPGFGGHPDDAVKYILPRDIGNVINQAYQIINVPTAAQPFIKAINAIQNVWKKSVTTLNPGFHFRNFFSNIWTYLFKDGVGPDQIESFGEAAKIVINPTSKDPLTVKNITKPIYEWYDELRKAGVHTGGFTAVEKTAPDVFQQGQKVLSKAFRGIQAAGSANENTFRVASALNDIKKGLTLEAASKAVNKAFVNYNDLTQVEQSLRKFIPFFSWFKGNLVNQITYMLQNPGRYSAFTIKPLNAINRLPETDQELMPEYMKQGMFVQPFGLKTREGNPLLLNPNLPFQDLGMLSGSPLGMLTGQPSPLGNLIKKILEGTTPLIKTPAELVLNRSQFTGQNIAENQFSRSDVPVVLIPFAAALGSIPGIGDKLNIKQDETTGKWQAPSKWIYAINNLIPILRLPNIQAIINKSMPEVEQYKQEAAPYSILSRTAGVKFTPFDTTYYKEKQLREKLNLLRSLNRNQ